MPLRVKQIGTHTKKIPLTPEGKLICELADYVANGGKYIWGYNFPIKLRLRIDSYTRYTFVLYDEDGHKYMMSVAFFMRMLKEATIKKGWIEGTFLAMRRKIRYTVRYLCEEEVVKVNITPNGWMAMDLSLSKSDGPIYDYWRKKV